MEDIILFHGSRGGIKDNIKPISRDRCVMTLLKKWVNHFSYGFSPKCFRLSPSCRHP